MKKKKSKRRILKEKNCKRKKNPGTYDEAGKNLVSMNTILLLFSHHTILTHEKNQPWKKCTNIKMFTREITHLKIPKPLLFLHHFFLFNCCTKNWNWIFFLDILTNPKFWITQFSVILTLRNTFLSYPDPNGALLYNNLGEKNPCCLFACEILF